MVRGHVLRLKSDEIYEAGFAAGMKTGEKNGARKVIFELIRDKVLSPADGAAELQMSLTDLEQAMAADSASAERAL